MPYATLAEVRALDGLADTVVYPDATLTDGIDFATELIDNYCGTSFESKSFDVTVDGSGSNRVLIGVLFGRTLTAVTVDGAAKTVGDFVLRPEGVLVWKTEFFPTGWPGGQNVRVQGTAAATTTVPERIGWAARTIARDYALNLHSRIPSRALQIQNEFGQIEVRAQAGGPGRPTNLPDVNAVLNSPQFKHKPGMGSVFG